MRTRERRRPVWWVTSRTESPRQNRTTRACTRCGLVPSVARPEVIRSPAAWRQLGSVTRRARQRSGSSASLLRAPPKFGDLLRRRLPAAAGDVRAVDGRLAVARAAPRATSTRRVVGQADARRVDESHQQPRQRHSHDYGTGTAEPRVAATPAWQHDPVPFFQPPPEPEPTPRESAQFYRVPWDQPDNALPGLGPTGLLLARTRTTAVHLAVTGAYPDGLALQVQAFFHPDHPYGPLTRPPRRPTQPMDDLRLGLQWPDGTRVEVQAAHPRPTSDEEPVRSSCSAVAEAVAASTGAGSCGCGPCQPPARSPCTCSGNPAGSPRPPSPGTSHRSSAGPTKPSNCGHCPTYPPTPAGSGTEPTQIVAPPTGEPAKCR